VKGDKRQPDDRKAPPLYALGRIVSHLVLTILFRLRRQGMENIPPEGGLLLISNHESFLDPPAVGVCLPGRVMHSMARSGLFRPPGVGWLLKRFKAISIEEQGGDVAAMKRAIELLREGEVVLIFPEGARTPDGRLHEFKRGVSVLLRRSRCPVVPVAIAGAYEAWPRHRALPRVIGQRVSVRIGEPIPHDELLQHGPDAALRRLEDEVRAMRDELHRRLRVADGRAALQRRLSGRDRVSDADPG
jgi:1-acyl-sn-glycerol-3-phosphate acyltransferase